MGRAALRDWVTLSKMGVVLLCLPVLYEKLKSNAPCISGVQGVEGGGAPPSEHHLGCSSLSGARTPQRPTKGSSHLHCLQPTPTCSLQLQACAREVTPGTSLGLQCLQLPSSPWISSSPFS